MHLLIRRYQDDAQVMPACSGVQVHIQRQPVLVLCFGILIAITLSVHLCLWELVFITLTMAFLTFRMDAMEMLSVYMNLY